jgi:serine protease AprX
MAAGADHGEGQDPEGAGPHGFEQRVLDSSIIAIPLLERLDAEPRRRHHVIIDLSLLHPGGLTAARERLHELLASVTGRSLDALDEVVDVRKGEYTPQFAYARLTRKEVRALVAADLDAGSERRVVHRVWPDFEVRPLLTSSVSTIKGDAAHVAFSARGAGIVWAVADTGIDAQHPHFARHRNLAVAAPLAHMDLTGDSTEVLEAPSDPNGHGTHVAGIIAGEHDPAWEPDAASLWASRTQRSPANDTVHDRWRIEGRISGVAPLTQLVSLRVLDADGNGRVSNLIAACGYVMQTNSYGRRTRIHGMNLSVGYGFDPEWFACGQSPLCAEVNRLVRSGVSVVVAAGNTGYWRRGAAESNVNAGLGLTINDPGNAELAITVGSTHRSDPHTYGVSYFSSKGPTGDGRAKPDLVAPGEKVLSCASGAGRDQVVTSAGGEIHYREWSGTSMAAPHVSGAIAALLSIRSEFVGKPERVKQVLLDSATDLGRERYFQGHGLVDLMRAIQSI